MDVHDPLVRAQAQLATLLLSEHTLDSALQRVAQLAADSVDGSDMAGVALVSEGLIFTGGASEELVEEIDSFQYATAQGPCLDALRNADLQRIDSTSSEARWPAFCAKAAGKGIESVLSCPLVVDGDSIGSLNLYARAKESFVALDGDSLGGFARQASISVANAQALEECRELSVRLHRDLESAELIGQSTGVLMERSGGTVAEAELELRRLSTKSGMTLSETARAVVQSVTHKSL